MNPAVSGLALDSSLRKVNEGESVVKSSEGGRARKTYKKTQLLREELLNAAEELFAERGFEKT